MLEKHGLSQLRINAAKDFAKNQLDLVTKIELTFQLSSQGLIDEEDADNIITKLTKTIERDQKYITSYLEKREAPPIN